MEYLYHTVECENIKSTYGEHDNVDFNLNFPNRALVCGSVRLEGELEILYDGTNPLEGTQRVQVDHMIGANAFIGGCVTQFQNQGIIENATELGRWCKMQAAGQHSESDMMEGRHACELRTPDKILSNYALTPRVPSDMGGGADAATHGGGAYAADSDGGNAVLIIDPDFSIKPKICLNAVASPTNSLLSYQASGEIKLSFNLARNLEALYGLSATAGVKYSLKNLEVCFTSVPDSGPQPLVLRTNMCLKSNINSQLSNHSSRVPAICDSMSASFLTLDREVSQFFKNTALEKPPNVSNVKFMFNDSTSSYITYELRNNIEIIEEGVKALSKGSHSSIRPDLLGANESYVLGLDFGEALDLSKQKFNIQIESEVSSGSPMLMFSYFHSLVTV